MSANGVSTQPYLSLTNDPDLRPDRQNEVCATLANSNLLETTNQACLDALKYTSQLKKQAILPKKFIPLNNAQKKTESLVDELSKTSPIDCSSMWDYANAHSDEVISLALTLDKYKKVEICALTLLGVIPGLIDFGIVTRPKLEALKQTEAYQQWAIVRKEILLNKTAQKFLLEDSVLKFLICPITKTLPLIPVKGDKRTFEYTAIKKWLDANPGKKFKGCDVVFTEHDLKFDFYHINTARLRIAAIVNNSLYSNNSTEKLQFLDAHLPRRISFIVLEYAKDDQAPDINRTIKNHHLLIYCGNMLKELNSNHGTHMAPEAQRLEQEFIKTNNKEDYERAMNLRYFGRIKFTVLDSSFVSCIKSCFGCEPKVEKTAGLLDDEYV